MMKNKTDDVKNSQIPPFIAPDSEIEITQVEIEKRKRSIIRAEEIGQKITQVDADCDGYKNPYRAQAMCYIVRDEEVPYELKQQIEEFDKKHLSQINTEVHTHDGN